MAPCKQRNHNGFIIKSLRASKAKLSELVERASRGEDVLITVRGKVKARLTGVSVGAENAEGGYETLGG